MPADDMARCGLDAAGSRIVAAADGRQGGVETVWARQKAHGLSRMRAVACPRCEASCVSRELANLVTAERVGRYTGPECGGRRKIVHSGQAYGGVVHVSEEPRARERP